MVVPGRNERGEPADLPVQQPSKFYLVVNTGQWQWVSGCYGSTLRAALSLADQQNKSSDTYQHRNQNTDDQRSNRMPTLNGLRPSASLRCSDA